MIKYGDSRVTELTFSNIQAEIEEKPQWINFYMQFELEEGMMFPEDLNDPSALVISTYEGKIIEYVVLNEGCDSEYQFTEREKEQITAFVEKMVEGRMASL